MCVLLFPVQLIVFGDQDAPDSVGAELMRLYELTVGFVKAAKPGACLTMPPIKLMAKSESPLWPSPDMTLS